MKIHLPPDVEPAQPKGTTMNEFKNLLASKTMWGAVVAVLPAVTNMFGYTITGHDAAEAAGHADAIVTAAGGLLAIYGRVVATKRIGRG